MNNNQIIEAEYKEVMPERLSSLANEIRYYSTAILANLLEVGRRFREAKEICPKGEWAKWVKDATGYEISMAENYIRIFKEYGGGQINLGGDFENSQSIAALGVTKLLELAKIPADEREEFVEENNITADTTVKELQELIKQKTKENERLHKAVQEKEDEMNARLTLLETYKRQSEESARAKEEEIKALKKRIEEIENDPDEADDSMMSEMIKEAEENAKLEFQKEINKLTEERNKAEKAVSDYKARIKAEKEKAEREKEKAEELQNKLNDVSSELARMRKQTAAADKQELLKIDILFKDIQGKIIEMKNTFTTLGNDELEKKVSESLIDILQKDWM